VGKVKDFLTYLSLIVGIVAGLLAIAERLTTLGILALFYPLVGQGTVFIVLVIVALASIGAFYIATTKRHGGFFFSTSKMRPASLNSRDSYEETNYGVKWHLYAPEPLSRDREAWVEGPYCPKCKRELEESTTGTIRKKPVWICPNCETEYERPKGNAKEEVRKDFEAYLRRKGEL
jgi:ribosomal protein L37AE/L43A